MSTPARTIDDALAWIDNSVKAYEAGEWDQAAAAAHIAASIAAVNEAGTEPARAAAAPARHLVDPPAAGAMPEIRTAQEAFGGRRLEPRPGQASAV